MKMDHNSLMSFREGTFALIRSDNILFKALKFGMHIHVLDAI